MTWVGLPGRILSCVERSLKRCMLLLQQIPEPFFVAADLCVLLQLRNSYAINSQMLRVRLAQDSWLQSQGCPGLCGVDEDGGQD